MANAPKVFVSWLPYAPIEEAKNFIDALEHSGVQDLYLAIPYSFKSAIPASSPKHFRLGFRFQPDVKEGSFTSSISSRLIKESGGEFVLLGLQVSREYFKEDNESIREKMLASRIGGVEPILCIGETWQEYSSELSAEVITRQLAEVLGDLNEEAKLTIVYEAPWTREAPYKISVEELDHAYHFCRDLIYSLYGESRMTVLCPIPHDQLEPLEAMQKIQADGYYLDNPTHHHEIKDKIMELVTKEGKGPQEKPPTMPLSTSEVNTPIEKGTLEKKEEALSKENKPSQPEEEAKEAEAEIPEDLTTFEEVQEIKSEGEVESEGEEEDNKSK